MSNLCQMCQVLGQRNLPLLARRGGRDIKKYREASSGADGVVGQLHQNSLFVIDLPPRLAFSLLRDIFLVARSAPPGQDDQVARLPMLRYPAVFFCENIGRIHFSIPFVWIFTQ